MADRAIALPIFQHSVKIECYVHATCCCRSLPLCLTQSHPPANASAFSYLSSLMITSLQLARQGLDVVLMSRSEEKLQKVANEIKEKHGRKTLVVPVDFSAGQAIYPAIAEQLRNLDIGVLGVLSAALIHTMHFISHYFCS